MKNIILSLATTCLITYLNKNFYNYIIIIYNRKSLLLLLYNRNLIIRFMTGL